MTNPETSSDLVRRLGVAADGIENVSFDRRSIRRGYENLLREAATTIERLTAERDELVAWFDGLTPNEMHASIVKLRERAEAAEALAARQAEALKAANEALVAWVSAAEALADQPGMDAHFHDVADATLDAVEAAKEAAQ